MIWLTLAQQAQLRSDTRILLLGHVHSPSSTSVTALAGRQHDGQP